jgi:large subunit ribosomal protein L29
MKFSEISELTIKELLARKRELRQEIFNLRLQQQSGQLERPHMLNKLRKDIARIETAISKKKKSLAAATHTA